MPIIATLIGAMLYRLRGGWWTDLTGWGGSHAVWAIPTAAFMTEMSHSPIWMFPILIVTNYAGLALFGNGQYLDDRRPAIPDLVGLSRNAIAAFPLAFINPYLAAAYGASGAFHAACYWAGFRLGGKSQLGECFVGGLCWLTIVVFR